MHLPAPPMLRPAHLLLAALAAASLLPSVRAAPAGPEEAPWLNALALPAVGSHELRILSPTVLELTLVTTKAAGGRVEQWDLVDEDHRPRLPPPDAFRVLINGREERVAGVGFK